MKPSYILFLFLALFTACAEQPVEVEEFPVSMPASLDPNGGTWRTVMGIAPADVLLPAPDSVGSARLNAQLLETERMTLSRTAAQEEEATWWASGAVLRWNQIARDLVVKYNRPLPHGVAPNPVRPVASPPFAARAYAMLSVAQYDALVLTWHHKFEVNRPAASELDADIDALFPGSGLPAYPSEDAAIALASLEVLKALFPLEEAYLQGLAQNHQLSRLWAGANVRNDLEAGATIGKAAAGRVLARASQDRMTIASDPTDTWLGIIVPYTPWESLDAVPGKPVLPRFGEVKPWFDSLETFATLPPPPPAIGSLAFEEDIALVTKFTAEGNREYWRIADFWADGSGTYAPPGHWNSIAEKYIRSENLNELRAARVLSLMNRAVMDAGVVCWYAKYKYFLPRPSQVDPRIKTATGIPNFPAYTSGHATFSMAAATTLAHLFPDRRDEVIAMAEEAGRSRVVSGIHYQFDNIYGQATGKGVADLAVKWALTDGAE